MPIMQGDKKVANVYNINNNSYSVPIGCIIPFSGSTIPVGFLLCDGSEVSKIDYADLYAIIADTYGTATDTAKFKLPDLRDRFVQGANGNLGTTKEAGLPNITGKFYHDTNAKAGLSGAFTYEGTGRQNLMNDTPTNSGLITFDASKSNPIYNNSDTVQPPSVCLNFVIKAEKISDQYADAVGALIDDTSVSANKVWSSEKVNNSTISYILIDTTKDIDFNEYIETGYYTPNKSFSTGWFTHSILNAPTDGWLPAGGFGLEVKTFDNTSTSKWFTQILYSYVGTDNDSAPIYSRTFFYDGTKTKFSPWKRIADIDDSKISSEETWSSQKINEKTAQNFDNRIILSVGRGTSGGYTNTANLNSANGAYLYWSSTAGQEKYSVGVILYIRNGWTIIPIKETDGGTNITFSIAGNVLTMEKSSSTFPSAGGVIALGTSL